jgi:hypothetical protein
MLASRESNDVVKEWRKSNNWGREQQDALNKHTFQADWGPVSFYLLQP